MALDGEGNLLLTGTSVTAKYSRQGALEWTAEFAGYGLAVGPKGVVYVTGFPSSDFSTVKLSASGSNEWVRTTDLFGRGYADRSEKVAVDELGDVYVAGGGTWVSFSYPPFNYSGFGVVKYGSDGEQQWVSTFRGEESFDMVVPAMKIRDFNFTEVTKF